MKNAIILTILLILVAITSAMAQTVYNVTTNKTAVAAGIPTTCTNCRLNISNGVTLTLTQNQTLRNTIITGGNVAVNASKNINL